MPRKTTWTPAFPFTRTPAHTSISVFACWVCETYTSGIPTWHLNHSFHFVSFYFYPLMKWRGWETGKKAACLRLTRSLCPCQRCNYLRIIADNFFRFVFHETQSSQLRGRSSLQQGAFHVGVSTKQLQQVRSVVVRKSQKDIQTSRLREKRFISALLTRGACWMKAERVIRCSLEISKQKHISLSSPSQLSLQNLSKKRDNNWLCVMW